MADIRDIKVEIEVSDDLLVRVTNVAPEDEIVISALALGNLVTQILRDISEQLDTDEDEGLEDWIPGDG